MARRIRPQYDSESEDDDLGSVLTNHRKDESDDDISSLSFGALSSAQKKLREQEQEEDSDSSSEESDSEDEFFAKDKKKGDKKGGKKEQKKKNKHAPSESSAKRPVSRLREIPGLKQKKDTTLYTDVRFDAAYGKADWDRVRKDYAFLDDYRRDEIKQMQSVLNDKKKRSKLSEYEITDLKNKIQSLQSRLDTLKNRDLGNKVIRDHKKEQMAKMRSGEQVNPYFLKRSEQRKLLQKVKFDSLKSSQREKVMERKRKRRLGKEFKAMEFR